ncbi:hypothetical protein [Pseudocnuella soli]|uniref:hypothetical protein n=1 Tax=Pseudocnuella soli TaxID=2502779 RepID=UPI00104B409B|nr:hypothetical protein [Pseudocnuella soli]
MIEWLNQAHALKLQDFFLIISINGAISFLIAQWVKAKIDGSIKHEYAKQLEDIKNQHTRQLEDIRKQNARQLEEFKFEIRRREQAAKIAELFALLYPGNGATIETSKANQINWELCLWLPGNILKELQQALQGGQGAKDPKAILIDIRKNMLQLEAPDITEQDIMFIKQKQHTH